MLLFPLICVFFGLSLHSFFYQPLPVFSSFLSNLTHVYSYLRWWCIFIIPILPSPTSLSFEELLSSLVFRYNTFFHFFPFSVPFSLISPIFYHFLHFSTIFLLSNLSLFLLCFLPSFAYLTKLPSTHTCQWSIIVLYLSLWAFACASLSIDT